MTKFGNLKLVNEKGKNETKQRRTHKLHVHVSEIYLSWKQIFFRPSLGCHVVLDYAKHSFVWQLLTLFCKHKRAVFYLSFEIYTQEEIEFPTAVEVTLDFFQAFCPTETIRLLNGSGKGKTIKSEQKTIHTEYTNRRSDLFIKCK